MYYENVLNEYVNRNMKLVATLWNFFLNSDNDEEYIL